MKARLMYRERDFDPKRALPPGSADLVQDLGLDTLFAAMAQEDKLIAEVVPRALLEQLIDLEAIAYRQAILSDCLSNRGAVRAMYAMAIEANECVHKYYFGTYSKSPSLILHGAVDILNMLVEILWKLRGIADTSEGRFRSEGFGTFFAMLQRDLGGSYFEEIKNHLKRLRFKGGVLISARLGEANRGVDYRLRRPQARPTGWLSGLFRSKAPSFTFRLHERDEAGARALADLRDRGLNHVSNAAAQSSDHILAFLKMVQTELAFYVGCLNLQERLEAKGQPTCFPQPTDTKQRVHAFDGLYDVCLSLNMSGQIVGNDLAASDKDLVVITGPNQGGKSTFARGIGQAQLMMQAGMCVPARTFTANAIHVLSTHYKREEDPSMASGKWDEELSRMSEIVDRTCGDGMVIFNESFQSTNEREGSSIARSIVLALLDHGVKVFFVTHMYDLARSLYERGDARMMFLRAERLESGERTFRVTEGRPLSTSHGEDLYRQIFLEGCTDQGMAEASAR